MAQNLINPLQPEGEKNGHNEERFESDTQKIIHRHLENKEDVITDEDIANVRVGIAPPVLDEATEQKFEEDFGNDEGVDIDAGKKKTVTPWDVLDEDE